MLTSVLWSREIGEIVELTTDKKVYKKGEGVKFTVVVENRGNKTLSWDACMLKEDYDVLVKNNDKVVTQRLCWEGIGCAAISLAVQIEAGEKWTFITEWDQSIPDGACDVTKLATSGSYSAQAID